MVDINNQAVLSFDDPQGVNQQVSAGLNIPVQNGGFGQGIKDFFSSPFFRGQSVLSPDGNSFINQPSTLNQLLPAAEFGLGVMNFRQQQDFNDQILSQANKLNRQTILAQLENANRAMGSREYNRLRMQGLSDEDARAGADQFVAERGLKAEQFGVKEFTNNEPAQQQPTTTPQRGGGRQMTA